MRSPGESSGLRSRSTGILGLAFSSRFIEEGERYDRRSSSRGAARSDAMRELVEFGLRNIPHERQRPVGIEYKGVDVGRSRPDFFVETELLKRVRNLVEIKAVESLIRAHTAQVISYLRAFDRPLGLLLNFQVPTLKQGGIKRVVLTDRGDEILGGLGVLAAKGE